MIKLSTLLLALLLISGCSSKSKFSPAEVTSKLSYNMDMKSELSDISRDGATYTNGMVLSNKRGLLKHKIEKDFRFIYDSRRAILLAKEDGMVKVVSGDKTVFEKKFDFALSSGAIKNNVLAVILSNNTLILYDIIQDKELYSEALEPTFANDARLANPLFLNDLVIFPTLDGRLLIVDAKRNIVLRDVSISDKELFNNVIFLAEKNNILVAATGSKIIAINPKNINTKRINVKDIVYDNNAIYLFTKTGKVQKLDLNLKVIKEIKFPFAVFSAVMGMEKLYAVEKSGYLIEMDKNLETFKVYELPSEIEKQMFAFKDRIFYGKHYLKID